MTGKQRRSKKPSGTKAELLLKESTFFVDVCLGKGVGIALRQAGLIVEDLVDHFEQDTPDVIWIPDVGARGWVVFTKDKAIRRNSAERRAVKLVKARMFTLPNGNYTGVEMADMFVSNLLKIGRLLKNHQPPFIARVSAGGVELSELPDDTTEE